MQALRFALYASLGLLLAVLVVRSPAIVDAMATDADFVAPVAMGQLANGFQDAQFVTGRLGWWEGAWVIQALRPFPATTLLALWLPLLLFSAAMAALAVQARQLWGNAAAAVLVGVVFSVHGFTLCHNASWSARGLSWAAIALVGVALIVAAAPGGLSTWGRRALVALAVLHAGAALSGDTLLAAGLLPPLGVVALAALATKRRRTAGVAFGLAAGVTVSAWAFRRLAESLGYLNQQQATRILPQERWEQAARETVTAFRSTWSFNPTDALSRAPGLIAVVLVLAVLAAGIIAIARRRAAERPATDEQRIWVVYWFVALGCALGAFWLADAAHPGGPPVHRYIFGAPVALGALAAAAWSARTYFVVPVVVIALVLTGAVSLIRWDEGPGLDGFRIDPDRVTAFAKEMNVRRGFTSYWSAYPLTVATDFDVDVVPVGSCNAQPSYRLCTMYLHYIDQAYAPRPGRSFVITENSPPAATGFPPAWARAVPDHFPKPIAQREVGEQAVMYVYETDVAPLLIGNLGLFDPRIGKGGPLEPVN